MKNRHMIGKKLKSFSVKAYENGTIRTVTKEDVIGKWSLFFFYPADFTFVCPTELKDLADHYDQFKEEGCEIYAVSTDSEYVHKAWADASETIRGIRYPMLADTAWKLSENFGVLAAKTGQALRAAFLLNPDGKIRAYEVHDMGIGRNAAELLRVLQAAKFVEENGDQVCPARWQPGAETIKPDLDLIGKL